MSDAVIIDDQAQDYPLYVKSKYLLNGIADGANRAVVDMKPTAVVVYDGYAETSAVLFSATVSDNNPVTFSFFTGTEFVAGLAVNNSSLEKLVLKTSSKFVLKGFGEQYIYLLEYAGPRQNIIVNGEVIDGGKRLVVKE